MISSESSSEYNVPGHNNATYGPIPKAEQVFQIEQFEVSPLPVPVFDHLSQLTKTIETNVSIGTELSLHSFEATSEHRKQKN